PAMFLLCCISLQALLVSGASLGDQVRQTPLNIVENRGEAARISCSHSIQMYNMILWYKRLEDKQLQLLGYRFFGETLLEPGVAVKVEGSADRDQTCTLMIKELNESSSGVYFCAASYHSAAQPQLIRTKTSPSAEPSNL
uniref:Immunoglobulin V-set domain-containing protein n=1 Tax=Poecilia reticulata TaxID=8081 RepID=A0A3P9NUN1_POERE